ncbi:hypothetical protein PVAP13_8NG145302 [Panicum virgatum]|uniref:Uncharacterized protein n=1 Tax=Panicum virgatum TaxID=38727 RepID=A0A8T0PGL6_PANVG|nr:hypothetical protein PVAP13_8NG145302 [Panicum virgatum]
MPSRSRDRSVLPSLSILLRPAFDQAVAVLDSCRDRSSHPRCGSPTFRRRRTRPLILSSVMVQGASGRLYLPNHLKSATA